MASPEARTLCQDTWRQAKLAREDLLEHPGSPSRLRAARAVFAQAECERAQFDGRAIDASGHEEMLAAISAARAQYQNAHNLYSEVVAYRVAEFIHAEARLGDLHLAFAAKLRAAGPPGDVTDPTERAEFRTELEELAAHFERQAALAYASALEKASVMKGLTDGDDSWLAPTCARLNKLDAGLARPRCPTL